MKPKQFIVLTILILVVACTDNDLFHKSGNLIYLFRQEILRQIRSLSEMKKLKLQSWELL